MDTQWDILAAEWLMQNAENPHCDAVSQHFSRFRDALKDAYETYGKGRDRQDERFAAIMAAYRYLKGDFDAEAAGKRVQTYRRRLRTASAAARTIARLEVSDGQTQTDVAKRLRVDRMTVRAWLGL